MTKKSKIYCPTPERGWPSLNDWLDPNFDPMKWFRPLGSKDALQDVCGEVRRFCRVAGAKVDDSAVIRKVNEVASLYRYCHWREGMRLPVSRTVMREGLQKTLKACDHLVELSLAYPSSWELAYRYHRAPDVGAFFLSPFLDLSDACTAALRSDEFSRRRGRAQSVAGRNLLLVILTRELMGHFAGRLPGFSRASEALPGPLVRTVVALYHYAIDRREREAYFYRYIAQAQQLSDEIDIDHYLLGTVPRLFPSP